jgi:actin related protein 2/3 complex subunit 2
LIASIALLKSNAMAAPYHIAFDHQQNSLVSKIMAVDYRPNECVYIRALHDRVTVIFATEFRDDADRIYAKVFLQVFI